jgi:NAD(P)H-nitrite reductase large subunit
MRIVVVGLHAAGRNACVWLRRLLPDAEIVGVDPEASPPYARPLISYVLARELSAGQMTVEGPDFWDRLGVRLIPERAAALDPDRKVLTLASGRTEPYDRLLAATGSSPRPAGVGGPAAGDILYFRTRADLERILAACKPGKTAAVLGGGRVGFKLSMGLLAQGMRVELLVTSPQPLSLNVDDHVGSWAAARLARCDGLSLRTGVSVRTMERASGGGYRLLLDSGEELAVDLVAAGKGVLPAAGWLESSGLACAGGLAVDDRLRTAAPDVYAAGDTAVCRDLALDAPQLHAIWPMAVEQGRIAAWNMAGRDCPYPGALSMNAIPLFGRQMVSVGAVNPRLTGGCAGEVFEDRQGRYLKLVFDGTGGRLIGAVGLDAAPRLGELAWAVRRRLARTDIPAHWLRAPETAAPWAARTERLAQSARL